MDENQIIVIAGIAFIPTGILISLFSNQVAKLVCQLARKTWQEVPTSLRKSEIVNSLSASAKEKCEHPARLSRTIKYVMGPSTVIVGVVFVLVGRLLASAGR